MTWITPFCTLGADCMRQPKLHVTCCWQMLSCSVDMCYRVPRVILQEAGATPAIELAFTIADGLEYIRCAQVGFTTAAPMYTTGKVAATCLQPAAVHLTFVVFDN